MFERAGQRLHWQRKTLAALDPSAVLRRGYSLVSKGGQVVVSADDVTSGDELMIKLNDGEIQAEVK